MEAEACVQFAHPASYILCLSISRFFFLVLGFGGSDSEVRLLRFRDVGM